MNKVILVGRTTADPELKYTGNNNPFSRFSIAINRPYVDANGEKETDFLNIVAWGKEAENLCQYQKKGNNLLVEGTIQTRRYTDADGNNRTSTEIVAQHIEYLDPKKKMTVGDVETNVEVEEEAEYQDPFTEYGEQVQIDDDFLD